MTLTKLLLNIHIPAEQKTMNWERILYDAGAFTAALFLLEYGADRFIDHSVIVANRLGVSQTLVAFLTAGAEWEEVCLTHIQKIEVRLIKCYSLLSL